MATSVWFPCFPASGERDCAQNRLHSSVQVSIHAALLVWARYSTSSSRRSLLNRPVISSLPTVPKLDQQRLDFLQIHIRLLCGWRQEPAKDSFFPRAGHALLRTRRMTKGPTAFTGSWYLCASKCPSDGRMTAFVMGSGYPTLARRAQPTHVWFMDRHHTPTSPMNTEQHYARVLSSWRD